MDHHTSASDSEHEDRAPQPSDGDGQRDRLQADLVAAAEEEAAAVVEQARRDIAVTIRRARRDLRLISAQLRLCGVEPPANVTNALKASPREGFESAALLDGDVFDKADGHPPELQHSDPTHQPVPTAEVTAPPAVVSAAVEPVLHTTAAPHGTIPGASPVRSDPFDHTSHTLVRPSDRQTESAILEDADPPPRRGAPVALIGATILMFVVGGFAAWMYVSDRDAATPAATSQRGGPGADAAGDGRATATPVPATAPQEAEPTSRAFSAAVVLETIRPVWLRVDVDGDGDTGRLYPAGERRELNPREAVVIRAGDAGAVMLSVSGGAPEPLGPAGQVLTRRIPAPPQ